MVSHPHHLVSRGYQRFFADGEQVRLIDIRSHTYLPAGTRDVFVEASFNSWRDDDGWNDELEQTWRNKVEGTAIGLVGQLIEGKAGDIQRDAAKALAALHLARSYSFDIVHNRILTQVGANEMRLVEEDPFYADLFTTEAGRAPEPDELAERVRLTVEAMKSGRQFLLERMVYLFNFTLEFFLTLNVALLYALPGMSFLTGDTPVVTRDERGFRIGIRQGVALGDTFGIFMPLGRKVAMDLYTSEAPPDEVLHPWQVQMLNLLVARSSMRFLACHPSDDPARLLADRSYVPAAHKNESRN